jgi:hypothetical protein
VRSASLIARPTSTKFSFGVGAVIWLFLRFFAPIQDKHTHDRAGAGGHGDQ